MQNWGRLRFHGLIRLWLRNAEPRAGQPVSHFLTPPAQQASRCSFVKLGPSRVAQTTLNRITQKRCKISQLLKPLSTSPGHFSDRTFFVTLATMRFSSLLSVINIDSVICLSPGDTSFVHFIALFGKAATALTRKSQAIQ